MTTKIAGRHRMNVRPRTPLTTIGEAVSTSASSVSRRSAVIAASSGLMVTMGLPAAGAAPLLNSTPEPSTGNTQQAPDAQPGTVTASSDAQVSFALSSLTTVDAAQYNHDQAVASAERLAATTTVSRADSRDDDGLTRSSKASSGRDSSTTGSTASTPSGAVAGTAAVDLARRYFGIKYRYGGTTPAGFDCSGFVKYVYAQLGVSLPRTAAEQSRSGTRISAADAKPGDIVSFYGSGGVYHNGIYIGNGQMINAPRTGESVKQQSIWSSSVIFTRVAS